jgi:hypothetical protein
MTTWLCCIRHRKDAYTHSQPIILFLVSFFFFLVGDISNSTAGVVVVLAAAAATAVAETRSRRNVIGAATTVYNVPEAHRTYSSVKDDDVAGAGNARSMLDSPTVSVHAIAATSNTAA